MLALLLLSANRVVSRERLIAELWPDAPGRDSEHALTLQISRLRKALSAAGDGGQRVVTRAPGYILRVEPDELDLERYERLVAAGRAALEARDAESAVARLRDAESLWRGRPLADLEFEPFARLEVERLEELRLAALEERIEAELAAGRHRTGLCPRVQQSGGVDARGPLSKHGPKYLRWALFEAALNACKHPYYAERYQHTKCRLGRQRGPKVAQIDLARRLTEAIWHMLTRNQPFTPAGAPFRPAA